MFKLYISFNYIVIAENVVSDLLLQYFNVFEINGYPITTMTTLVNLIVKSIHEWLDKDYRLPSVIKL